MATAQVLIQYLSSGTHTFTVPAGFSNQVAVYAWGAGGGNGSYDRGSNGVVGGGGGYAEGIVTAGAGSIITVCVGERGQNGPGGTGVDAQGGIGNTPTISFSGGLGARSTSRDEGYNGPGGGGGAATAILVNDVPMLVAAGGGGGGGGAAYQKGTVGFGGGVATSTSAYPKGADSARGYATGGGGGGGYPLGGAAGRTVGDDAGAPTGGYGGQNYANSLVTSSTLTSGSGSTPGGVSSAFYPGSKRAYNEYDGAVIVILTKNFRAWTKDTTWKEINNAWIKANGSWKAVTAAWMKTNGEWKRITSGVTIDPVRLEGPPSTPVSVNISIAANTNNYVLSDFLSSTAYYPGYSVIELTVDANVVVASDTTGVPALTVDGLTTGDKITLINNGTIQGRGGDGGAGGVYTVSGGSTQYDSKGNPVYSFGKGSTSVTRSIPGRPGSPDGIGLETTYQLTLINNGLVGGGGGGGCGRGGNTGGDGGGGAGYSSGANDGTLSAAGAGASLGGAGGAIGVAGSAGTADTNPGGVGGKPGPAIKGINLTTVSTEGTITGPRINSDTTITPHSI